MIKEIKVEEMKAEEVPDAMKWSIITGEEVIKEMKRVKKAKKKKRKKKKDIHFHGDSGYEIGDNDIALDASNQLNRTTDRMFPFTTKAASKHQP